MGPGQQVMLAASAHAAVPLARDKASSRQEAPSAREGSYSVALNVTSFKWP